MSGAQIPPHVLTKLAGEHYLQVFSSLYGLETLNLRYTMFLSSGIACRAIANVTIKEAKTAKQQLEEKPRNSPDHTKRRTVKMGETLALIAHEEYNDAAEWRRIADANGILDPKDVKPGTVLTLPPIL